MKTYYFKKVEETVQKNEFKTRIFVNFINEMKKKIW